MSSGRSQLPAVMRLFGWVLFVLTLLYPWDAFHTWYAVRDLLAAEAQPASQASGIAFDQMSVIDCGIVGWLGGVGTLLSLVWLLAASVAWLGRRARHEPPLAVSSRVVLAAVLAGVLLALGTQQYFERVHGALFM